MRRVQVLALAIPLAFGCDSGPEDADPVTAAGDEVVEETSLVGTWRLDLDALQAWLTTEHGERVGFDQMIHQIALQASAGLETLMVLREDGSFRIRQVSAASEHSSRGTWSRSGETLRLTADASQGVDPSHLVWELRIEDGRLISEGTADQAPSLYVRAD